jgi:hypothetical protein
MHPMNKPKRTQIFIRYKNAGGKSKVQRFHLAKDAVTVINNDGTSYIYTNQSAGPEKISKMKTLALAGKGLDSFIESDLKDKFGRKIR